MTELRKKPVLYLDVNGVLLRLVDEKWEARPDAEAFLQWAVEHFTCRWLTAYDDPNIALTQEFNIRVPHGIEPAEWKTEAAPGFKAAAISDGEDWLWVDDGPTVYDLDELKQRGMMERLVPVDPEPRWTLMQSVTWELMKRRERLERNGE